MTTTPLRPGIALPASTARSAGVRRTSDRTLILTGATAVAIVSTAAAYTAMVGFGRDVLEMAPAYAYAFAGVFELSLVTVALMAREAVTQNRPAQTLLTLTWVMSLASGVFAGWHEIHLDHPAPAAGFRFIVPLLAALMWHLALIGDRHLATGRSWSEMRTGARMHAMLLTAETWHRARATYDADPTRLNARRVDAANRRRLRARSIALRTVDPGNMARLTAEWTAALEAASRGTTAARHSANDTGTRSSDRPGDRHSAKPSDKASATVTRTVTASHGDKPRAIAQRPSPATTSTAPEPTARRARVAELLAEDRTGEEIASALGVSLRTVRRDIAKIQ